ncbi:MAG: hypothetical protein JWN41_455 [Thermoleophilia bacterium]|nr:hypothetical protein [Thermoleophilia bacterium]
MPAAYPVDRRDPKASALARYSRRLPGVEINSSFHRSHRPTTWARWAATTPSGFRFAAKLPRTITHDARLRIDAETTPLLDRFLLEFAELGARRGPVLVQLAPSLAFDRPAADAFFTALRARWPGLVGCEPRHPSWFEPDADATLIEHEVARVAADPARVASAAVPGGWPGFAYLRLHGSPRMYYSEYDEAFINDVAAHVRELAAGAADTVWCVFDNTAAGAALGNALAVFDATRPC